MQPSQIQQLIHQGEGLTVEFKTAQHELPQSIFETVCAFLNRLGGSLLLGVKDNGEVVGVENQYVEKIKKELANALNNPQILNPPIYIIPNVIEIEGKTVLFIPVHESSQVHNTRGKIFDRNEDGDYNISSHTNLVASMYIRKQTTFTENKIYPFATINELRTDIISRARQMAVNRQPAHAWESLNDMELLRSVQLYQTDYSTGKEGLTLAAILLFGRDEVIQSVLPFHKTDAICRIQNLDRYDDRDDIRTNLIESYDRLMRFVEKHLSDKFVLKDDIRISVRNLIFREIIANTLIHREYTNPYPAKLLIEQHSVKTENANKAHGGLELEPETFSPFPKNPVIARVFKEIGRADELGSGVRNIYRYYNLYSVHKPLLHEEDVFKCTVFIDDENFDILNHTDNVPDVPDNVPDKRLELIMGLIKQNNKVLLQEIAEQLNVTKRTVRRDIEKLKLDNKLKRVGSEKGGYWQIMEGL